MERPIECDNCGENDHLWRGRDGETLCLWCGHDRTTGDELEPDWETPNWVKNTSLEYLEKSGEQE